MLKLKKIFKPISVFVLLLTFLCIYGFSVAYTINGGRAFGPLTKPFRQFVLFPYTVKQILISKELKGIPLSYTEKDDSLNEINKLTYDVYGINSFLIFGKGEWEIKLFNFRTDSIIYKWHLKKKNYIQSKGNMPLKNAPPLHSILLPNRSLITLCNETKNLYRLDKNSSVIWHNTSKVFHHSLNIGVNENIWTCTAEARGLIQGDNNTILSYRDDFITNVDIETGKILFDKSVSEILIENGYTNYVHGFTNQMNKEIGSDPIHLNDVEPVLSSTPYWKKGDLFISLRNKSLIFLYRPKTNKIIHLLNGPFLNQHDVDIISDSAISLFNNNVSSIGSVVPGGFVGTSTSASEKFKYAEILIYNFKDSTYKPYLKHHFKNEKIYSFTQCLHELLSSGDVYVESQNNGTVYIMNPNEVLLKKQFSTSIKNMVEQPHWIRTYDNIDF